MVSKTPQRTNPAIELYKYCLSVAKFMSPEHLIQKDRPDGSVIGQLHSHATLYLDGYTDKGKPIFRIGHYMKIWPNGHFNMTMRLRKERWFNSEREILQKHTFLHWGWVVGGRAMFVQDAPRSGGNAVAYGDGYWPDSRDFGRHRPYLPYESYDNILDTEAIYKLVLVDGDWRIRCVGPVSTREDSPVSRALFRKTRQASLDRLYGISEARYERFRQRKENEEARKMGYFRAGAKHADRAEILSAFVDRMIVFEPKSTPAGQKILPFTREEAMSDG